MSVVRQCPAPEVHLLGEIVVAFSTVEVFLEVAIWQLLASNEDLERSLMAQAVTAEMSFDRKVHAFASMFRQKAVLGTEQDLQQLVKDLFEVQQERNTLMHSTWHYSDTFGGFGRMKATAKAARGLKRRFHRMPAGRIQATRNRITVVAESLARFAMTHIQPPQQKNK